MEETLSLLWAPGISVRCSRIPSGVPYFWRSACARFCPSLLESARKAGKLSSDRPKVSRIFAASQRTVFNVPSSFSTRRSFFVPFCRSERSAVTGRSSSPASSASFRRVSAAAGAEAAVLRTGTPASCRKSSSAFSWGRSSAGRSDVFSPRPAERTSGDAPCRLSSTAKKRRRNSESAASPEGRSGVSANASAIIECSSNSIRSNIELLSR